MPDHVLVRIQCFDRPAAALKFLRVGTADFADPWDPAEVYLGVMAAAPALVREIGLWGTPLATPAPGTKAVKPPSPCRPPTGWAA